LRGVAILCVLALHFALAYDLKNSPIGLLPAWLRRAAYQGNFGVTIFFTLSGYLIVSMSLRRWGDLARIKLREFYLYRAARILPCLLLALAIIVALGLMDIPFFDNDALPHSYFLIAVGSILTFWHNQLMQSAGYFNYCLNVYWSLSVEEMFYLLLPVSCLLLRKRLPILLLCAVAIVAGPLYRSQHTDNEIYFMYGYLACFDAIAIGCVTALLMQRWQATARQALVLRWLSGLVLAALYVRGIHEHEVFGFTLVALATAGCVLGAGEARGKPGVLQWLGRHSYEIYLFHIIVLAALRNVVDKPQLGYAATLPWFLVFILLTALVAAAVARYVSDPANAAIRRAWMRKTHNDIG
jgi:peptidoglycan/LPS O-acetylase OafA/YrhL